MAWSLARNDYVRMLTAVYASMFLIRLAFGVVVVTFADYVKAGDLAYSLIVTAGPVAEAVTVVFAGILIDRYGRKGVLLTGLGLGAFSLYGLALTTNVLALTLLQGIHGIAAAFIIVTTLAVIATYAPANERGRAMGIFNLVNIVGWIGGFVLGSLLIDAFATRLEYTFVIAGALATVGLLYANRAINLPSETRRAQAQDRKASAGDLLRALGSPRILVLATPWLIVFALVASFITFFPRIAGRLDLTGGSVALATLLVGLLMLASQYFWGRLSDRHGRESIMLIGALGFVALMGVIVYAFFETGSAEPQVIFDNVMSHGILLSLCLFVALAFAPAGLAALADEAHEGTQGTTMSTYSLTLSLGFIVGPPTLGAVSEKFGGRGMVAFFAVLALALLALVLVRFVQRGPK